MKISYNWLKDFIPGIPGTLELSNILTSVGLEVESLEKYEEIKGGLQGLVTGAILECEKHPEADKLKVTKVDIGTVEPLQIVCGAPNVSVGQKVVVAPVGAVIYSVRGEEQTMKKARIRGIESFGMICAEDEIGLGSSHAGIMVLPENTNAGLKVSELFKPYEDWIFEIGLTPNRADAMSHYGVAKDVCAYLSHQNGKLSTLVSPYEVKFKADNNNLPVTVIVENTNACERYAGVTITNVKIEAAPKWMQQRLKSIGIRPVNNIVDITNYVLHETGQPLHAFDADAIKNQKILVKNLPAGTPFTTLDEKERKLDAADIMICNGDNEPICFGGIFGGLHTGITENTINVFLESAWFNPSIIRKTSLRQMLRTDAATRFEKGVDISQAVHALIRAVTMIKEIAGGQIASEIIDVYHNPEQRKSVTLFNSYLKKISGKCYSREVVKNILSGLDFEMKKEESEFINVTVPFNKPDITIEADIIEEIMRIDGYDNVEIPATITITPEIDVTLLKSSYEEKIAAYLTGSGFSEIFTNSITNSSYYDKSILKNSVRILNSLSIDLDIMRPALLETALESIAYNLNRKNNDLLFFEFGNSYSMNSNKAYFQNQHLCLYVSGNKNNPGWKQKPAKADFYFLKGICKNIYSLCGLNNIAYSDLEDNTFEYGIAATFNSKLIGRIGMVSRSNLEKFSIKQNVIFADLAWDNIQEIVGNISTEFTGIPRFPPIQRDLSMIVSKSIRYAQIESILRDISISKLSDTRLFDVFESEKLGLNKKSMAISFTFTDTEKTLTDKEIDGYMNKIILSFETKLGAEIRKQ